MQIEYDKNGGKFLIKCKPDENMVVSGMPDRRFRKTSGIWAAPALRRNIEYMCQHMNNPSIFSKEALEAFNDKRRELTTPNPTSGEDVFPAWYKFKNPPLEHQHRGLHKFYPLDACGILYEQGLGKTFTSINLATAWRMTNKIEAVVVLCPSSIKLVWGDELVKHCPIPYEVHALTAGKYGAADKFIENKTDFQWMVVAVEALSQGNAIEYLERFLRSRRCAMIIDESSRIKTPGKTRTDRCIKAGKAAVKRVILSGTSITQGLEDLYTQFKFLDPDIIGYNSYYTFRAHFCRTFSMVVGYDQHGNERTVEKVVGYQNEDEFVKLVSPYVERVEKKDALDLPEKTFTTRYVTMNPTQKKAYADMEREFMCEVEREIHGWDEGEGTYEVTSSLEQLLRLQQITGGHYPFDDGSNVVPKPIPGINPKLAEVMSLMDEISGKVIIWFQFRPELDLVADALAKADVQAVQFHGGCDDTQKEFAVHSFVNDPKTKVFLATRAAAYGLTLTSASTAIYYSQSYSLEEYAQSQDRIHRIGQKDQCTYIHLVCDKTVDTKVVKSLAAKANVANMMYDMIKGSQK